jgi:glutamate/tyrosine decarboxylase-like PLP-dependent enzyme
MDNTRLTSLVATVGAPFPFDAGSRSSLALSALDEIDRYDRDLRGLRVSTHFDQRSIRATLESVELHAGADGESLIAFVAEGLRSGQTHTSHPACFGLFVPATTAAGVAADILVAGFNPQLANWSHAPFAVEMERWLIEQFARRFGFDADSCDGTFTSGGAEANHTALVVALARAIPEFRELGLAGEKRPLCVYGTTETHHSIVKALRVCGLGAKTFRRIYTNAAGAMDADALRDRIRQDCSGGHRPLMIVATAGTTAVGAIDPLNELAAIAAECGAWMHVDAAWGGAAAMVPDLHRWFEGIERADSITFDPHKWLSVPMGAGMLLTRHRGLLERAFSTETAYMPRDGEFAQNPYARSLQWSRRFIGLKVFLSLGAAGWRGWESMIRSQIGLADRLRAELRARGWSVLNDTPLPVLCFVPEIASTDAEVTALVEAVNETGKAWLSTVQLPGGRVAIRACISSGHTESSDVDALVVLVERAWKEQVSGLAGLPS